MSFYNSMMNIVELTGCTFDDAFLGTVYGMMIFFGLLGFSTFFFMDVGRLAYDMLKIVYRFLRRTARRFLKVHFQKR